MDKKALLNFVKESRALLPNATPSQKVRLIKLLKEYYKKINEPQEALPVLLVEEQSDYLPEK